MNEWLIDQRNETKASNFLCYHEWLNEWINEWKLEKIKETQIKKSVHVGHAASNSCVPHSIAACTGHAGKLYF